MKIFVRGGHGINCKGAIKLIDEQKEMGILAEHVVKILKEHGHEVRTIKTTSSNMYKEMDEAHNLANGWADYFITIHANASNGQGNGAECWVYDEKSRAGEIGNMGYHICYQLEQLGFANRSVKINPNFYDLRKTTMPAMIVETFFVDSVKDVNIFNKLTWDRLARAIANGIDRSIPLETPAPKPAPVVPEGTEGFYRVITGSYKNKANAEKQVEELKGKGVNSFIAYYEK